MSPLLVVAGEGSGDAFAAPVVKRLGVPAFGIGGPALAAVGVELCGDLRVLAGMGLQAPILRAPKLAHATLSLARAVVEKRPRAALLVGFSEVNARLAPWLRTRGVRVLFYAPPQVWAWRRGRARRIAATTDLLAVVLPFEVAVWEREGAHAVYVGHPTLELEEPPHRDRDPRRVRLLIAPGSRSHEVRAHLSRMCGAARRLRERLARGGTTLDAVVALAPALDPRTRRDVAETARANGVDVAETDVPRAAAGADCALVASGTATLECAVLAVPPVIVYRTDPVTFAVARRLVRVPHIGLPNLVLGRPAFAELVQSQATEEAMTVALEATLANHAALVAECAAVKRALAADTDGRTPSSRVAEHLLPWLA